MNKLGDKLKVRHYYDPKYPGDSGKYITLTGTVVGFNRVRIDGAELKVPVVDYVIPKGKGLHTHWGESSKKPCNLGRKEVLPYEPRVHYVKISTGINQIECRGSGKYHPLNYIGDVR